MLLDYVSMEKNGFFRSYFVIKALCFFFHASAAKESSSPADLMRKLVEFGFSSSTETRSFAEDMYAKVPHKQAGPSVSSQKFFQAS